MRLCVQHLWGPVELVNIHQSSNTEGRGTWGEEMERDRWEIGSLAVTALRIFGLYMTALHALSEDIKTMK